MAFAYLPVNIGVMIGPGIGSLVTKGSVFAAFPTAAVLTAASIFLLIAAQHRPVSA